MTFPTSTPLLQRCLAIFGPWTLSFGLWSTNGCIFAVPRGPPLVPLCCFRFLWCTEVRMARVVRVFLVSFPGLSFAGKLARSHPGPSTAGVHSMDGLGAFLANRHFIQSTKLSLSRGFAYVLVPDFCMTRTRFLPLYCRVALHHRSGDTALHIHPHFLLEIYNDR